MQTSSKDPRGGHNRKTDEQHWADGSWRADRHELPTFGLDLPPCPPRVKTHYKPQIPFDFDDLIESTYDLSVNESLTRIASDLSKKEAKRWAWDASDELAIANGCRFDVRRGMHLALVLRQNLLLWEGRWAGEPFILRTWQPECLLRIFGWVRPHRSLGWVRRYSKAAIWTPKKSGKSPTGAAVAIYLWRFDGPWIDGTPKIDGGSHVYCVAKNGKQAGIVWNHACNMVEHSPTLQPLCETRKIKKNSVRSLLRDEQTLSHLTIVTGDSAGARAAAEGLNAKALIVDEAHVVDSSTLEILRDCGASQEEHLTFQISTYGSTEGYGKADLERGFDIQSGKLKDDGLFFKSYCAPADITDAQCGDEAIWYAANPNLGYTVSERQFRQTYERTKDDPADFAGFKQRRLNIWQRAFNPMFNHSAWLKCAAQINWQSLAGVGGAVAFDLASTQDWASMAIAWDEDSTLCVWARVWTSEEWVAANSFRAPFVQWAEAGHLIVHEGGAIDFTVVQDEILDLLRHSQAGALGFDKTFGMTMGQEIQRRMPHVKTGYFTQAVENYAAGTAELKNAVKNGTLKHPNNPVLDWQAGHVMGKRLGEHEKPVKPERDGHPIQHLKIDSMQAITMAIKVRHLAEQASAGVILMEPLSDEEISQIEADWNDHEL